MGLINKLLNIVLPILALISILFLFPPYLIYKLFKFIIKVLSPATKLAGIVVIITGASSGIGEHLAYEYARRGARLSLVARREDRLRSVAAKAAELGSPDAIVIRADVSKTEDCKRIVEETINHFGQLDHLVNNAGVVEIGLFADYTELSTLRSLMDINFWGSIYCTQFAIPHLKKTKGKITVISSSATWYATPRLSIYNASKAAQLLFFESLKAEFGSEIGITIVTPGLVESEIVDDQFLTKTKTKGIPIGRAQSCAREIVESGCRGELYLTVPSWNRVGYWYKVFFPQLFINCFHLGLVNRLWTNSNSDTQKKNSQAGIF